MSKIKMFLHFKLQLILIVISGAMGMKFDLEKFVFTIVAINSEQIISYLQE